MLQLPLQFLENRKQLVSLPLLITFWMAIGGFGCRCIDGTRCRSDGGSNLMQLKTREDITATLRGLIGRQRPDLQRMLSWRSQLDNTNNLSIICEKRTECLQVRDVALLFIEVSIKLDLQNCSSTQNSWAIKSRFSFTSSDGTTFRFDILNLKDSDYFQFGKHFDYWLAGFEMGSEK